MFPLAWNMFPLVWYMFPTAWYMFPLAWYMFPSVWYMFPLAWYMFPSVWNMYHFPPIYLKEKNMASSHRDYIPRNAAQFRFFMENIIYYVIRNSSKWTAIPQARISEMETVFAKFISAFDAAAASPMTAYINSRNEAQAEAAKVLRAFVNQYLRFDPVTNFDRTRMGIPNHDTIRTDHMVVTELVDFVIQVRAQRELSVEFWQKGQSHKAKPQGYDGAVLVWDILDVPPVNHDNLTHHTMASKTPYPLYFTEEDRGKRVYVALCWQNERGITGQWSDIKDAVVP
jgi:hypothetical protein